MKAKFITIALASILTLGISASAQNANGNTDNKTCTKTECQKKGNKERKDCKDKKNCKKDCKNRKNDSANRQRQAHNPFAGLQLTQQQQEKLAAIPTPRQVMQAARQNDKDNKTQADTSKAARAEKRQVARNIRDNYLKQVKAVLTPDQYVQFLENYYVSSPGKVKKGDKIRGDRDGKAKKDHGKRNHEKKDRKNRNGGEHRQNTTAQANS